MPDSRHKVSSLNTVRYPFVPWKTKDRTAKGARNEENGSTSEEGRVSIKVGIKSISALLLGQFSFSKRGTTERKRHLKSRFSRPALELVRRIFLELNWCFNSYSLRFFNSYSLIGPFCTWSKKNHQKILLITQTLSTNLFTSIAKKLQSSCRSFRALGTDSI